MVPLCAIGQSRPLSDSCQLFADERHEPGETLLAGAFSRLRMMHSRLNWKPFRKAAPSHKGALFFRRGRHQGDLFRLLYTPMIDAIRAFLSKKLLERETPPLAPEALAVLAASAETVTIPVSILDRSNRPKTTVRLRCFQVQRRRDGGRRPGNGNASEAGRGSCNTTPLHDAKGTPSLQDSKHRAPTHVLPPNQNSSTFFVILREKSTFEGVKCHKHPPTSCILKMR
jgi:hypothetical protein